MKFPIPKKNLEKPKLGDRLKQAISSAVSGAKKKMSQTASGAGDFLGQAIAKTLGGGGTSVYEVSKDGGSGIDRTVSSPGPVKGIDFEDSDTGTGGGKGQLPGGGNVIGEKTFEVSDISPEKTSKSEMGEKKEPSTKVFNVKIVGRLSDLSEKKRQAKEGNMSEGDKKNFNRALEAIHEAAEETEVPEELLQDIAWAESSYDFKAEPEQTTPSGKAGGLFQFTTGTWKHMMRLYPNLAKNMGERFNPEISAKVAAKAIEDGWLEKWDASKSKWGQNYEPEEISEYYKKGE